jgi:hypothetical protein
MGRRTIMCMLLIPALAVIWRLAAKLNGRTFEKLLGLFDRFAVGKELQRIVG